MFVFFFVPTSNVKGEEVIYEVGHVTNKDGQTSRERTNELITASKIHDPFLAYP